MHCPCRIRWSNRQQFEQCAPSRAGLNKRAFDFRPPGAPPSAADERDSRPPPKRGRHEPGVPVKGANAEPVGPPPGALNSWKSGPGGAAPARPSDEPRVVGNIILQNVPFVATENDVAR